MLTDCFGEISNIIGWYVCCDSIIKRNILSVIVENQESKCRNRLIFSDRANRGMSIFLFLRSGFNRERSSLKYGFCLREYWGFGF